MTTLSWFWIVVAVVVPSALAVLVAWPIWRSGQAILGNVAGTLIIMATAMALIMREHVVLDRVVQACLEQGTTCWPEPSAFTRYAIYAFIGLAEVIALFLVSLKVEAYFRRRDYAPEWR